MQLNPYLLFNGRLELDIEAFRRYGKGQHRAGLNIGDCFATTHSVR